MNFSTVNGGKYGGSADYRDRDRRWFHFARYCYNTKSKTYRFKVTWEEDDVFYEKLFGIENSARLYAKIKKIHGPEIEEGIFFKKGKLRTCYGFNYPKHRREGATTRASAINAEIGLRNFDTGNGIQAMDENTAGKVFNNHVVKGFDRLPWFFKPVNKGMTVKKLEFKNNNRRKVVSRNRVLDSYIDYATTCNRKFYDSEKLAYLHNDECGKTTDEDVFARWLVQRLCLSQGSGSIIHGFAINTSTVGEMDKQGGENFFQLCEKSRFGNRTDNGTTETGLLTLFISAYDSLEGFIDEYGMPLIENLTEEQKSSIDRDCGSKEYLEREIASLRAQLAINPAAAKKLNEIYRLHPLKYRDCFRKNSDDSGFNALKMSDRYIELQFMKKCHYNRYFCARHSY